MMYDGVRAANVRVLYVGAAPKEEYNNKKISIVHYFRWETNFLWGVLFQRILPPRSRHETCSFETSSPERSESTERTVAQCDFSEETAPQDISDTFRNREMRRTYFVLLVTTIS